MIKVLELIDGGFIGGGQMHILSLCKNLSSDIHSIIAASSDGDFKTYCLENNILFEDINLPKIFRKKYLQQIKNIVDKHSIQLIHSHGGVAGMYSRFYKKYYPEIKVVHSIHGIHYINSKNIFRKYFTLSVEQYLSDYADKYICTSKEDIILSKKLKIANPEKTELIYNGINLDKFITPDDIISRADAGLSDADFVLGNISRFDEQKNQKLLIRSMPDILKVIPEAKLFLIGDGKYLKECIHLAEYYKVTDQIIFQGSVKHTEYFYPLFNVFVFPSLWEGFSLTILEALASGRVVLANALPSIKEIIQDGINGFIFEAKIKNSLIKSILHIYENRDIIQEIKVNTLKSVKKYTEKNMTMCTEKIYNQLINI